MRIGLSRNTIALIAALAIGGAWWLKPQTIPYWIGEAAPGEPLQEELPRDIETFQVGEYTLKPRATFDIAALVLGTERYRFDQSADLAPLDLALGWGPMTDRTVLETLQITQFTRFFWVKWDEQALLSPRDIFLHASNIHIIPASPEVLDQLRSIQRWDVVQLGGVLVDAWREDGFRWRTSTTRTDTGNGACELFYVESVEITTRL